MEDVKLIVDSGANARQNNQLTVVPLIITIAGKDFIDDEKLNMDDFIDAMAQNKEAGKTSCPSIDDWLRALEGSKRAVMMTITSGLSGSYSSAFQAKQIYEKEHPDSHIVVADSRSAGPEMAVILGEIRRLLASQIRFVDLEEQISKYKSHTHLLVMLQSLHNLALSGRINLAVAKVARALKINVVGTANLAGKLEPISKARGIKRALKEIIRLMEEMNYQGGRVVIDHCRNQKDAETLRDDIIAIYPQAEVDIRPERGLCSFYAEDGSLMVGFAER
ncbi:DegV family protein [Lactobacillus xylocopicola]|uniref:DegV family protein n=1 Tax=Lactobacillus xylocopicola TaxID=2976676 RepID=A0ABN6SJS2_9LACO|nr:DegV family protein [Lactobacillus xylocopicola]BDR60600.1 hypothetical protein KIM322_08610 [Lactobacillus xylocopicola]